MNNVLLPALMILMLSMLVWYFTKRSVRLRVCPICVAVSGTWLILSAGIIWGFFSADFKMPVIMLMGGTVVGIAFQAEKLFKSNIFYFKSGIIIVGMPIAYYLFLNLSPLILLVDVLVLLVIGYIFAIKSKNPGSLGDERGNADLEEKLKNCC